MHRLPLLFLVCVSTMLLGLPGATAEEPDAGTVRITMDVELMPNGDGRARLLMRMSRPQYGVLKANFPNAQQFLRDFSSRRSNSEPADATATYEDARSAVRLELTEIGGVRNNGGGQWALTIGENMEFVTFAPGKGGRMIAHFYEVGPWGDGVIYRGNVRYTLPAGASDFYWNLKKRTLEYTLEREAGTGPARLNHELQAKPRLMTSIYKVYGLGANFAAMWVAKGVFKNEGKSTIRNLKVRYKLDGYSEWSPWQRFPEVVPEQSCVSLYYPVLRSEIAKLTSNTPANLLAEWRYEDIEGREREDSAGARIVLLGGHEFVFSNLIQGESYGTWHEGTNNAPFVAAWVSRDDLVIKQFAAMANKNAGGVGASSSDEDALKVLKAIYELWQINDFTYQHPPGVVDKSMSFDVQLVQNIKYPRDVIRDKSGTCIDLAILYAALANNLGLRPYLAFIPGHCFPVFELPSGNIIAVEATGIAGGLRHGSASFEKMLQYGIKELVDARKDGRLHMIDCYTLWTNGVANPELAPLPPDILNKWGIRQTLPGGGTGVSTGPGPGAGTQSAGFAGTWGGNVQETMDDGSKLTYPMVIQIQRQQDGSYRIRAEARAQMRTNQGVANIHLVEDFVGKVQNNQLLFRGTRKTLTVNGNPIQTTLDQGVAQIVNGKLQGRSGNDTDGYTPFNLSRR
ncbi:MAG: hypothetical protein QNJ98_07425 [Planctomycetota bacterium]|nr:hypothetical protein [Planctomycetota bacterium]